ncbi:MAG: glycosyltransferase [Candidatus Thorarchaeota archaeon]|nr:glycosyltransferase [Candidatus Thorarchaeota archaeon]
MRIAIISTLPPQETGESPYAARLIESLVKNNGVQIVAVTGKDADALDSHSGRIQTQRIWDSRSLLYPITLAKCIKEQRVDIVHVQFGPYGKVYGGLFGEIMLFLLILLRAMGIKTTITLHSTWMPEQVSERVKGYGVLSNLLPFAQAFFRLYMRLLDWGTSTIQLSTVRMNSALRTAFRRNYEFIDPEKILEIPHPCAQLGKPLEQSIAAQKLGLEGKTVVLMFGFIRRGKGFDIALHAISKVRESRPETLLLIAGRPQGFDSEEYMQELRGICQEFNLSDNVRFDARFIPEEEISDYFAASSILLIPYTESVGASGPIHNYAGYGVPILASDVGYHNRDSVGGNLFLFKAGSADDLSRKLTEILDNLEETRLVSRKQVEYTRKETWDLAGERTLSHYRKTLKT